MGDCTHHWTVTSECPMCLRADLDESRLQRNAAFALLRVCKGSVHPATRAVIEALIGDDEDFAAMAGREVLRAEPEA